MPTTMTRLPGPARLQAISRYANSLSSASGTWRRGYSLQPRKHECSKPTTPRKSQRFRCVSESSSTPAFARSRTACGRKSYATEAGADASTIQGTIGKGAEGVAEEAQRAKERLPAPDHLNEQEKMIFEKLERELEPTRLEVQDISGGCGSMYGIDITSERFRGLGMLKQQRLVNDVLGEEIKGWHGVQLKTKAP